MNAAELEGDFEIVVSRTTCKRIGAGATSKKTRRVIRLLAASAPGGKVALRNLNDCFLPVGREVFVDKDYFLEFFTPEPLITLNKYAPNKEALICSLDRGDRYRRQGRLQQAEREYEKAGRLDSSNLRALFGLGAVYLQRKNPAKALTIFNELLQCGFEDMAMRDKHLFNEFGIRLRKAGLLRQSLRYYGRAFRRYGDDEHLLFNMARVLYDLRRERPAIRFLQRALELNDSFAEARLLLEHISQRQSRPRDVAAQ
jgi:tetratricopeptide (TPR) repeat protein